MAPSKPPKITRKPPTSKARHSSPAEVIQAARAAAFTDQTPRSAFEHFRPLAESITADPLHPFNGQPLLLRANILTALATVEPHLEAAVVALREPPLREVFELPALAMALEFAVGRVPVAKLSAHEIKEMLAEGAPWRGLMLDFLEVASHPLIGVLPRERVAAVRAGSGKLDMAQDFVALPGLFAEFEEALRDKHPFPTDALARLGELGAALVQTIRPGRAVPIKTERPAEAILRDQLAWLVAARYDQLGVIATVALGKRKADALLPALRGGSVPGARIASNDTIADEPDAELEPEAATA